VLLLHASDCRRLALFVRGLVFNDLSQGDRGRADIERAFALSQRELNLRSRDIWTHCQLSEMQLALFDIDPTPQRLLEAQFHADQALQLAPTFWDAWRIRGVVDFHRKDFAPAERNLLRALELNSRDAWAACHLGLTRHALSRSEEGIRDLDRAISLTARFGYYYRSRGLILNALNDRQGAIGDLTRALELNPRFAEAYHLRGKARLALGDQDGGSADLRRAAELDSKYSANDRLDP
jgi:tetratricopeptide (TPR) repeat protein